MKNITLTTMRNRRLRRECREAMERRGASRPADVIDSVIESPVARGFFFSVDHALEMDRRHRAGTLPQMVTGKRLMWEEFFRAVDTYQRKKRCTRLDAVCYAVSHATCSRFYLSRDEALRICRHINDYD